MSSTTRRGVTLTAENVAGYVHAAVESALVGKKFSIVLVGPAGVGKSTLVNTLIMKQECVEGRGAASVTGKVEANQVKLPLKQGRAAVTLEVYDSPGFTGDDDDDDRTIADLQKIPSVDLLLICFDITADGGRYTAMKHGFTLKKVVETMGKQLVRDKALIVLTKCNLLSPAEPEPKRRKSAVGPSSHPSEVDEFLAAHIKRTPKGELEFLTELEARAAGRLEFDEQGRPRQISDVNGSKDWLSNLFNKAGVHASTGFCALLYVALIQACSSSEISREVKENFAKPGRGFLAKVLQCVSEAGTALWQAGKAVGTAGIAVATGAAVLCADVGKTLLDVITAQSTDEESTA